MELMKFEIFLKNHEWKKLSFRMMDENERIMMNKISNYDAIYSAFTYVASYKVKILCLLLNETKLNWKSSIQTMITKISLKGWFNLLIRLFGWTMKDLRFEHWWSLVEYIQNVSPW